MGNCSKTISPIKQIVDKMDNGIPSLVGGTPDDKGYINLSEKLIQVTEWEIKTNV